MQFGPRPQTQEYCRQSPCQVPPAQWGDHFARKSRAEECELSGDPPQVDLLLRTWAVCVGVSTALDVRLHSLLDHCCNSTVEVVEAVATFWMGLD